MPKISWKVPEKPKPKPNVLKELFKSYMKAQKLRHGIGNALDLKFRTVTDRKRLHLAVAGGNQHLRPAVRRALSGQKLTAEKLAPRMNISVCSFKKEITRPVGMWRLKEIEDFCRALQIPLEDAMDAAARSL